MERKKGILFISMIEMLLLALLVVLYVMNTLSLELFISLLVVVGIISSTALLLSSFSSIFLILTN